MQNPDFDKLQKYQYIIYDFDKTIGEIQIDWEAWHDEITKIFQEFDPKFVRHGWVNKLQNAFFDRFGEPLRHQVVLKNAEYEISHYKGVIANQPLIDFIKQPKSAKQYILTANGIETTLKAMKELDLPESCFEKIFSREDIFYIKPNPEGVLKIIGNHDPKDFVLVGDSSYDAGAALNAGIDFEKVSRFSEQY